MWAIRLVSNNSLGQKQFVLIDLTQYYYCPTKIGSHVCLHHLMLELQFCTNE